MRQETGFFDVFEALKGIVRTHFVNRRWLQFETGQDWLNKNRGTNYDYPVIHLSQLVAYAMGMEQEKTGLQFQMMGKNYIFQSEKIKQEEEAS